MTKAFLSLGSNLGDRIINLHHAIELISNRGISTIGVSSFYETEPWGYKGQPPFINAALEVEVALNARELLSTLKSIELEMGREESPRWGPRLIDIDIIFFGNEIVSYPELTIPHPLMHKRLFVLEPLVEIAPDFIHPLFNKNIKTLLEELNEKHYKH